MQDIDLAQLQTRFAQVKALPKEEKTHLGHEWWQTGITNLNQVAPSVGAMWRLDRAACMMALRAQFPGADLDAIRRFAEWCSTTL